MPVEVLTALDKAKTQWYHFTAIIIAGMGFFTDAYDLFCISTVTKLLGRIYYFDASSKPPAPGVLPPGINAAVTGVALVGTLAGQLFFGWLGDKLGRKSVYGVTLLIMIVFSVCSALSFGHTPATVMFTLCFCRFWLGFGIGGDYPLSATIMSEYANTRTRGAFIAAVFAMQGFGILTGASVSLIVSAIFRHKYPRQSFALIHQESTPPQADYVWRIVLAFGAVPAALTFYYRMRMPETARYTALVAGNAKQAAADMSKVLAVQFNPEAAKFEQQSGEHYGLITREFFRRHGMQLIGTSLTWFLLDIAYYSQNLFSKDIFTAVKWLPKGPTMSALEEVYRIARANALLALGSTVPGYWFTVFFVDRIGRFRIQLMGFFFMTVFMFSVSIPYDYLKSHASLFVGLYSLTFFFSNFGPNATTFIVPAELFPARLRATCHGISAAAGKAGAIVGAFGFLYAAQDPDPKKDDKGYSPGIGIKKSLLLLAVTCGMGFFATLFLIPETNQLSLEELSGENKGLKLQKVGSSTRPLAKNPTNTSEDYSIDYSGQEMPQTFAGRAGAGHQHYAGQQKSEELL